MCGHCDYITLHSRNGNKTGVKPKFNINTCLAPNVINIWQSTAQNDNLNLNCASDMIQIKDAQTQENICRGSSFVHTTFTSEVYLEGIFFSSSELHVNTYNKHSSH